jgi:hypothetical protein
VVAVRKLRERFPRLLLEASIGNERRVLVYRPQRGGQVVAQHVVPRRVTPGREQRADLLLRLRELRLDAHHRRRLRRATHFLARRELRRSDRLHRRVEVRAAVLERIDIEAEAGEDRGDRLEVGGLRHVLRGGETADACRALAEHGRRARLVQHLERALRLLERLLQPRQISALVGLAEEGVQSLLDRAQARADLAHHLPHERALLRTPCALVEERHFGWCLRRLAACASRETLGHRGGLCVELGREGIETRDRVLHQEQRRRHLELRRVTRSLRMRSERRADVRERRAKGAQVVVVDRCGLRSDAADLLAERADDGGVAAGVLVPGRLRGGEQIAERAECRLRRSPGRRPLERFGDGVLQAVGVLHVAQVRCRRPDGGDLVERLAHQPLGNGRRALDQPLHLLLDAVADALRARDVGQGARDQSIEEAERRPPERTMRRRDLCGLDRDHGGAHVLAAARVLANELEQPALIAGTLLAVVRLRRGARHRHRRAVALRRPRAQVRIVEVDGIGRVATARRGEIAIGGVELERLVGGAAEQFAEIRRELADRALDRLDRLRGGRTASALQVTDERLDFLREPGHAVEPDDGERAVRLMEVRLRGADLRRLAGRCGEAAQACECAFERLVDLAPHPGQRADVEVECAAHRGFSSWPGGATVRAPQTRRAPRAAGRPGGIRS